MVVVRNTYRETLWSRAGERRHGDTVAMVIVAMVTGGGKHGGHRAEVVRDVRMRIERSTSLVCAGWDVTVEVKNVCCTGGGGRAGVVSGGGGVRVEGVVVRLVVLPCCWYCSLMRAWWWWWWWWRVRWIVAVDIDELIVVTTQHRVLNLWITPCDVTWCDVIIVVLRDVIRLDALVLGSSVLEPHFDLRQSYHNINDQCHHHVSATASVL